MTQQFNKEIRFRSIGYVENEIEELVAPAIIRSVESRIVIDPTLEAGLLTVTPESRLMVIFQFHQSDGYELLQHPRRDPTRAQRGVFALRTPRRPNPIGVTIVDIDRIEGNVIFARGLDAINGTPVIDLKPA